VNKHTYGDYALFAAAIPCLRHGTQQYYGSVNVVSTQRRSRHDSGEVHDFEGALFDTKESAEKYAIDRAISIIVNRSPSD
jgi:hypothetical protein